MIENYIVFDIETTGLQPKSDRIIEIGAVKVEKGEIVDTFSTLIQPEIVIQPMITGLTGIDNEMVKDAPKGDEAIPAFIEFCKDVVLMGHNVMFDYSFVKRFAVNHKLPFEHQGIDTLKIARSALPNLEKKSLEYLCNHYQIIQEQKHRALEDAKSTYLLYKKMLEEFGESQEDLFLPKELVYQVKKESSITNAQKGYLKDLIKYHKIELDVAIDSLTKNEASRYIDKIILQNGRIVRT